MGRAPMAHPPGSATRARRRRARSGPRTSTEARIVRTSSYGAWWAPPAPATTVVAPSTVSARLAQRLEHALHRHDVAHPGEAAEDHRLRREQRCGEARQGGVLGSRDLDLPVEPAAAVDAELFHDRRSVTLSSDCVKFFQGPSVFA